MRRFRRALVVGVVMALMTLMMVGVAAADRPPYGPPPGAEGPPVGGCPTAGGWILVVPSGPEHLSAAFNFNGYDGDPYVCARLPSGNGAIAFMDNVVR